MKLVRAIPCLLKLGFDGLLLSLYNVTMFFAALCLLMILLLANGVKPDVYGWVMLVGTGWFSGYMDGRIFRRSDNDTDRVVPPDISDDGRDADTFQDTKASAT